MASATSTYEQVMKQLAAGQFAPVYLLHGDESYYIDKVCDAIQRGALREEERDFNETVLFGADTTDRQVEEAARRFPMMAERQLVIVKEAQGLKNWDAIARFVDSGCMATTVLVICHKGGLVDKRKALYKAITKAQNAVEMESMKLKDWKLAQWVEAYVVQNNASIEPKAAQMMADYIGADLARMAGEVDKLLVSFAESDNRRITPQLVQDKIGVSKDFNPFELRDAFITKNVFKANQILNYFDKNPKAASLYTILPQLFSFFKNLMVAHYAPRKDPDSLAAHLDLRSKWGTKDYITGMQNYSAMKTMLILGKIREIDAKSKGLDNPNTSASDLMKELAFFILH